MQRRARSQHANRRVTRMLNWVPLPATHHPPVRSPQTPCAIPSPRCAVPTARLRFRPRRHSLKQLAIAGERRNALSNFALQSFKPFARVLCCADAAAIDTRNPAHSEERKWDFCYGCERALGHVRSRDTAQQIDEVHDYSDASLLKRARRFSRRLWASTFSGSSITAWLAASRACRSHPIVDSSSTW